MKRAVLCLLFGSSFLATGCGAPLATPVDADFSGDVGGCGTFSVHRFNADRTLAVHVRVAETAADAKQDRRMITLPQKKQAVVTILQFAGPATSYFCDDVYADDPEVVGEWLCVSGELIIVRHADDPEPAGNPGSYRVSVELRDATFELSGSQRTCVLKSVKFEDVLVGWLAG